jgi:hypothetical protein
MSLQTRRPTKLSFRVRRNFATRDWTSIGQRGLRVTSRKTGTHMSVTVPGSNPSDTQEEDSRSIGFEAPTSNTPPNASAASEKDWSEWLWLSLIALSVASAATVQLMQ